MRYIKLSSILFLIFIAFAIITPLVYAVEKPNIQIDVGGLKGKFSEIASCPSPNQDKLCIYWISQYIVAIYKYAIGVVGIIATVVLMIGGLVWLTSGGNQTRVSEAKAWIGASITGLLLTLGSFMILATVNPKLTQFEPIKVAVPAKIEGEKTNPQKSADNTYCEKISDCPEGFICDFGVNRCKSTTLDEGVTCDSNGKCASVILKCVGKDMGRTGWCYDGSLGDACCSDSDCKSNKCNKNGKWFDCGSYAVGAFTCE